MVISEKKRSASKKNILIAKAKQIEGWRKLALRYELNPKICIFCNSPLPYNKRRQTFCNHSCAAKLHMAERYKDVPKKISFKERRKILLENSKFEDLGETHKREVILKDQDFRCARCSINEWRGQYLTLELDHIDGDNKNWSRDNLEFLCPNCHSQTPTWRGRNNLGKTKFQQRIESIFNASVTG